MCGQHCLNNLLQGPYFSPVELSDLAQSIDNQERAQMAECGTETDSYKEFIEVSIRQNMMIFHSTIIISNFLFF